MLLNKLNNFFRVAYSFTSSFNKYAISKRLLTSGPFANEADAQQGSSNSDDLLRNRILESSLKFVTKFGFTTDAIEHGFVFNIFIYIIPKNK